MNSKQKKTFFTFSFARVCVFVCMLCAVLIAVNYSSSINAFLFSGSTSTYYHAEGDVAVHYLDVGQADCSFVQLPNGQTMLIDAGLATSYNYMEEYLDNYLEDDVIDFVVLTHAHKDHYGAMQQVLDNFDVQNLYIPTDTEYLFTENALNRIEVHSITNSTSLSGDGFNLQFYLLYKENYDNINNQSAVMRLKALDKIYYFTGDAEHEVEDYFVSLGIADENAILQVGHHGSNTSSTANFLSALSPSYAIVSCGQNGYGHPHPDVMQRLSDAGAEVYVTLANGSVVIGSAGVILNNNTDGFSIIIVLYSLIPLLFVAAFSFKKAK